MAEPSAARVPETGWPASGPSTAEVADPTAPGLLSPDASAMTVDVEDYFQVQAFASVIRPEDWDRLPSRVERNTESLLDLFADKGVHATFFVLGWVAERNRTLVRRIADGGHEVASHGWAHVPVTAQSPEAFREDVRRTKALLEDLTGASVAGYRAASFSINAGNLWAHAVLREEGYRYSSSIYPIRHDLYGMAEAPRSPFHPAGSDGVVELPITTARALGRNWPCGGGGYFRLLPFWLSRWSMRRARRDGLRCIFYMHPWEIDPGQPRQVGVGWRSTFRHYVNLGKMAGRLSHLLDAFAWDRMDRVYRREIEAAEP